MVSYSDIQLNNTSLLSSSGSGPGPTVAIVGGTSGIGHEAFLAVLKHTPSPTIYLVGRSEPRLHEQIKAASPLNPTARIIPIVAGDLTLVRDAQAAASSIAALESSHLDLLLLSPGYFSFATKPNWTSEGLDKVTAIRYHARLRFVLTLLPLLRAAPSPRIVSVLAGGKEGALDLADLSFKQRYGPILAAGASASLTTLAFEALAAKPENANVVFVHLYPGGVATGLKALEGPAVLRFLFNHTAKWWLRWFGRSPEEAGARVLFAATNGRFRRVLDEDGIGLGVGVGVGVQGTLIEKGSDGRKGSGVYLVQADSSVVVGNKKLSDLRARDGQSKVLEYTEAEFERIEKL